jgi:hypothetical protein
VFDVIISNSLLIQNELGVVASDARNKETAGPIVNLIDGSRCVGVHVQLGLEREEGIGRFAVLMAFNVLDGWRHWKILQSVYDSLYDVPF